MDNTNVVFLRETGTKPDHMDDLWNSQIWNKSIIIINVMIKISSTIDRLMF